MASLLLVVKHWEQQRADAQLMVKIARDTSTTPLDDTPKGATAGGDERKLRGIPAIGRGVAGAIPGTSPHNVR